MLDLRIPSGLFFVIVGFILLTIRILNPGVTARMADGTVNLWAGIGMLLFGLFLLGAARAEKANKNKSGKK